MGEGPYPYVPYSPLMPTSVRTFLWAVNRLMAPGTVYEEKKKVPEGCRFTIAKLRAYGSESALTRIRITLSTLSSGFEPTVAFQSIPALHFLQERHLNLDTCFAAIVKLECDAKKASHRIELIFEGVQTS